MIVCKECSATHEAGAMFCNECGFELSKGEANANHDDATLTISPAFVGMDNVEMETPQPKPPGSAPFSTEEPDDVRQPLDANALKSAAQPQAFTFVIPSSGRRANLTTNGQIRVGRRDPIRGITPELDLTPDNGGNYGVSRLHAAIRVTDKGPILVDLNSTNGTFLNSLPLSSGLPYPITSGDEVRFGHLLIHIFFTES